MNQDMTGGRQMKKRIFMLSLVMGLLMFVIIGKSEAKKVVVPIGQDGVQRVDVLAGSYFYEPDYIVVKKGLPVEITIKKEPGLTPHNIVLKNAEAGIDIEEDLTGEPKVIRFIPKKAGKYSFYCTRRFLFFKSHREQGMEGILEVSE